MLAETRDAAFTRPGWLWELKYDGYRLLAGRESGKTILRYRHGMDSTATFPEIARAVSALPCDAFVLDGEVVVLDPSARPRLRPSAEARPPPAAHRHRARRGRAPGDVLRLRPSRLRGLRPARPAALDPQGAPAALRPEGRARPLRRPHRGERRRPARGRGRARPRGRRREEGGLDLSRGALRGLAQGAARPHGRFRRRRLHEARRRALGVRRAAPRLLAGGWSPLRGPRRHGFLRQAASRDPRAPREERAGDAGLRRRRARRDATTSGSSRRSSWRSASRSGRATGSSAIPRFCACARTSRSRSACARRTRAASTSRRALRRPPARPYETEEKTVPFSNLDEGLLAGRGLHQGRPHRVLPRDLALAPALSRATGRS